VPTSNDPILLAIWNTNAFFAYIITVKLFKLKWEARKLVAVVLATCGVAVVVYGGATQDSNTAEALSSANTKGISKAVIGNLLTLVASFGYGLYQVMYKIYGALPNDPETKEESDYQAVPEDEEIAAEQDPSSGVVELDNAVVYPPPFGFHSNLFASLFGVATCLLLWTLIPILDYTGVEPFRLPTNWLTVFSIIGLSLSGVVFNSGLMVNFYRSMFSHESLTL
jgi:drug/metabolite transporter (DMT)-like permease